MFRVTVQCNDVFVCAPEALEWDRQLLRAYRALMDLLTGLSALTETDRTSAGSDGQLGSMLTCFTDIHYACLVHNLAHVLCLCLVLAFTN